MVWMKAFLQDRLQDLRRGLRTLPKAEDAPFLVGAILLYAAAAAAVGFSTGYFSISFLDASPSLMLFLPFTLFVMPCLLEEIVFRGLMLPHPSRKLNARTLALYAVVSISAFTLWHPLNALTINQAAQSVFTDLRFLFIAGLMAVCCTAAYLRTGSLWVSILIHWLTVLVWVFFLGGRNLVLD